MKNIDYCIGSFENGNVHTLLETVSNTISNWNPHPKFRGVYLKHMVTGSQTQNKFSCHIVKIEAGCMLDVHIHEGITELHEIMNGSGICIINGINVAYKPGDYAIIPNDTNHQVIAGENGLVLFAKFFPSLL